MPESVLDRIVAACRRRQAEVAPLPGLAAKAREAAHRREAQGLRSLAAALKTQGPSVIAECKHASPSAGVLREPFDPVRLAECYAAGGAAAISVVTEPEYFLGREVWIEDVRAAVSLPVLKKDFIVTVRQVEEAAVLGADAILLIQRILSSDELERLLDAARELRLEVLLELFVDEDPAPAVASGASILGVNARDLATFETRVDRVLELARELPEDRVRVAESGIRSAIDLKRLATAGYDGFLIGEHLVRAADPRATLEELRA